MTTHQFAWIAVKILGLYFMVKALIAGANACLGAITVGGFFLLRGINSPPNPVGLSLWSSLLPAVVELGIGLLVWRKAGAIASLITRE